jgi:hypothetical protein
MFMDFASGRSHREERERALPSVEGIKAQSGLAALLRHVLREPLTHFVAIGIAIFFVVHGLELRSTRYTIEIDSPTLAKIANSYAQQYGAQPDPTQLRALVDNHVREEIFLREGLDLGLDKNDEIVRRRIAQKFHFLQQDMTAPREPSETALRARFDANRAKYRQPARRTFEQIYFAMDRRGDGAARSLAAQTLKSLIEGHAVPAGDSFPGPQAAGLVSQADASRLFGNDRFGTDIFRAPVGTWAGPFRSGFGWHLVRVTDAEPERPRTFDQARADVVADWKEADRAAQDKASYARFLARYEVHVADSGR